VTDWNDWSPSEIIKYFTQEPPVNVTALAEALGLNVQEKPFPDISGMLMPDPENGGPSGYSIVVNSEDSETRKRFTIAHEIAHFLLHRNKDTKAFTDNIKYRSPGVSDEREAQANRLAADILMPRRLIRKLLDEGITQPNDLAKKLCVSPMAMEIRLGVQSKPKSPKGANPSPSGMRKELSESIVGN
jgi:hypothetical protein